MKLSSVGKRSFLSYFFSLRRFPPGMETIYRTRQNDRALFVTRLALLIALITYVLFGFWDYWLDSTSLQRTLPIRTLFSALWLGLCGLTFVTFFRQRLLWILSLTVISTYISVMWVLNLVSNGLLYGMLSFAYPQFVSLSVPNSRFAAFNSAMLMAIFNIGCLVFQTPEKVFLNGNFVLLPLCVVSYFCAYANEVRERHVFGLEYELEKQATTDSLTGIFNRGHFLKCAQIELDRAQRYNHALVLLMLDIDHFKQINDSYGHRVGDETLRQFSRLCQENLRSTDVFGRIGGEEFAILLPETDPKTAENVAQRLRQELSQLIIPTEKNSVHFTVSIGLALLRRNDDIDSLMQRADTALYQAKREGRNRVILSEITPLMSQKSAFVNKM